MKRNLTKQENVVAALWEFAANQQHRLEDGQVITAVKDGTKVNSQHILTALGKIMEIFGYEPLEVQ